MVMSFAQHRHNMIERQIRTWDVLDNRVLSLYTDAHLRREDYIDNEALRTLAYADIAIPIASGQHMLEPKLEARILQVLEPRQDEKILHVGTGSGFFAALLAKLSGKVITTEIFPNLAESATKRLAAIDGIDVEVVNVDAATGLPSHAPYNAIVMTGALPCVPKTLLAQLLPHGRLLAVVGTASSSMHLRLIRKHGTALLQHDILETSLPPLHNVPFHPPFHL